MITQSLINTPINTNGRKTARGLLAAASVLSGSVAVTVAPQGTASAYCEGLNNPRSYYFAGAKESFQSSVTCDGEGDYWGYIEDIQKDGKDVFLEYTSAEYGYGFVGTTKKGVNRINYGWDYQPPGWGTFHLCHTADECSSWISNKDF